ncbi:hypothetical protein TSACC_23010 [Terrimicrobium sacchariphilum]|uniref:Uncharacterized protein n=1 Tax=Terrimicrobium sacchariphilum TaxID=690879 RepID=A0A146GAB1_TERSA|nr:hypothetical protein TSACC_23010 [Terrimicrobium sacchariphilum]
MNPLQFIKKARWRKIAIGLVFLIVLLVTLLVFAGTWFSYQGRREWAQTKVELLKRGELLSFEGLAPAPVPPEKNFFADPIWEPNAEGQISLFDPQISPGEAARLKAQFPGLADLVKEGNRRQLVQAVGKRANDRSMTQEEAVFVLALLEPVQSTFDTIRRLGRRSEARFPVDYSRGVFMPMPHDWALFEAGLMLWRSAQAHDALGQTEQSLDEILLMLRLSRAVDDEPIMMSFFVATSIDVLALSLIERQLPTFSDRQTQDIELALGQINVLKKLTKVLRGERAIGNQFFDQSRQISAAEMAKNAKSITADVWGEKLPGVAWDLVGVYRFMFLDEDQAFFNKTYQRLLDRLGEKPDMLQPSEVERLETDLEQEIQGADRYRHALTSLISPKLKTFLSMAADEETKVRQARIACAIQRYALAEKALPSSLDQLVPKYLEHVPGDVISGGPMHYRSDGKEYVLWSVGWNDQDDGGEASPQEKIRWKKLDWVWKGRLPAVWKEL